MINNILLLLYYSLFLFTPLIMTSITSELFEFNKMIFIYLITTLILFFWILKMIVLKKIILEKTLFDIPVLLFFISQILSTLFSIDKHTSFYGYYGRFNGGLLSIICYLILYFAFTANFLSDENIFYKINKLLKISVISSFVVILWGLPGRLGFDLTCFIFTGQLNNLCWTDQFHPDERMFSTLGQPNWLGAYLSINFFISLYFIFKHSQKKSSISQFLYFFISLIIFIAILFTRSRSAIISIITGLLLFFFFLIWFYRKKISIFSNQIKMMTFLLISVIIALITFKTGIEKVDKYLAILNIKYQISNISKKDIKNQKKSQPLVPSSFVTDSMDIRKIVWSGAIELGKKYPLFGTGVETFAYSYYFVRPIAHNLTSEWDYLYNKAHNEYLNYLATTGFIGLGSYLIMIGMILSLGIKKISNIKYLPVGRHGQISNIQIKNKNSNIFLITNYQLLITSLLLSYLSILITNFFGFSTTTINLFFYLIPAFIVVIDTEKNNKRDEFVNSLSTSQWIYISVVVVMTFFCLVFFVNYFLADINYARSDIYFRNGSYQSAAQLLDSALKMKYEHVYEDKLSFVLANLAVAASYQKQSDLANKIMLLSDSYNKKSIQASPKNVLYWKTKAKIEYLFYQITLNKKNIENGITALSKAYYFSSTDPKIPYSLAIFYSLLFDEEKNTEKKNLYKFQSINEINRSIYLKPDYRESYFLKGQLLKKYGDKKGAKEAFNYIIKHINPQDIDAKSELEAL